MSIDTKRPRVEALTHATDFKQLFPADLFHRWEFAGSLRRRRPLVGDIDHVILPVFGDTDAGGLFNETQRGNLVWARLDDFVKRGVMKRAMVPWGNEMREKWGDVSRAVEYRGVKHDLTIADADNWGWWMAVRTGPALLSKNLVVGLRTRGITTNEAHLYRDGVLIPHPSEEDVFRMAGLRFIPPESRGE